MKNFFSILCFLSFIIIISVSCSKDCFCTYEQLNDDLTVNENIQAQTVDVGPCTKEELVEMSTPENEADTVMIETTPVLRRITCTR